MNKKRRGTKRILAWFLCLAMVLTTLNLPFVSMTAKAETDHTPTDYTLNKEAILIGDGNSYSLRMNRRVILYKGDTVTVIKSEEGDSPKVIFIGISMDVTDGISMDDESKDNYEGIAEDGSDVNVANKFTVTSEYPVYFTYKTAKESREYGSGSDRCRYQYHCYSAFTFKDSIFNLSYALDGGIQKSDSPLTYDMDSDSEILFEAPVKKGFLLKTIYDENSMFRFTPVAEESGYRSLIKMSLKDITTIDTRNFGSSAQLSNVTIKTTWKSEYGKGTIEYNANGGTINGQESYLCETGVEEKVTLLNKDIIPVKEGYTFAGWYANAECTDDAISYVTEGEKLEGLPHYTVYAKWDSQLHTHDFGKDGKSAKCASCEVKNINYSGLDQNVVSESKVYTGNPITSDVTITGLKKDVDYIVENVTETEVGSYSVKIIGIGNYDGERVVSWGILPASGLWCATIPDQTYTGKAINPAVEVYCDGVKLTQGIDYTVAYGKYNTNVATKDAVNAGKSVAPSVIITGKGNYSDKKEITFNIVPYSIHSANVEGVAVAKGKSAVKVNPVVKVDGKTLKLGTDYVVSTSTSIEDAVTSYAEAGVYNLYVVGKNNYTGYVPFTFTITEKTLASKVTIAKIADQKYNDGKAIKPEVKITYNKKDVTDSFNIDYKNNREIGTATVVITAKNEEDNLFAGSKTATFKITGEQIKNAKLGADGKGKIPTVIYKGSAHEPDLDLYDGATPLTKNVDYTVTFDKNVNVGTATATVVGKGKYTGSKKFSFKIDKYDAGKDAENCITVDGYAADEFPFGFPYEKGGVTPKPEIKMGEIVLKEKTDYTLSYANNKAVAAQNATNASGKSVAPAMTITFKGNLTGKKTVNFEISTKSIDEAKIIIADKPYSTKANAWKQTAVTIIDTNGKKLVAGTDYEKTFKYFSEEDDEITADTLDANTTVYVEVVGINNYKDSCVWGSYRISKDNLSKVSASIDNQTYTGRAIEPSADEIKVWVGSGASKKDLVAGEDYVVVPGSYTNNINKGTATVTIIGKGNYYGTKVVKYTIGTKKFLWWEI